ncbi:MAG: DUF1071 domain-containing protein [Bacteroidota bacterium]|jgi:hypothetical protein
MESKQTVFERLSAINVNDHVEQKDNLSYLSWAWAWSEVKKAYPNTTYRVLETEFDEALGFMCHTSVTIEGETLDMWLPVMDSKNKAMKKTTYTYPTKYGDKTVEAATMFDINKTIMRCLVKNLAMFGLGIYIYAGEDLPEVEANAKSAAAPVKKEETKADELIELKKGTSNWVAVVKYVIANKEMGIEKIGAQLVRKYKISPALKKEIANLITQA